MSTPQKAAQIIRDHGADTICNEPECIAQDLADAGLLAPDLSEIKFDKDGVWREDEEEPDIFVLTQNLPRRFVGIGLVNRDENHVTIQARPVEETRELAHVLLAAADHAEEQQK